MLKLENVYTLYTPVETIIFNRLLAIEDYYANKPYTTAEKMMHLYNLEQTYGVVLVCEVARKIRKAA
jgi:hypothetical protein